MVSKYPSSSELAKRFKNNPEGRILHELSERAPSGHPNLSHLYTVNPQLRDFDSLPNRTAQDRQAFRELLEDIYVRRGNRLLFARGFRKATRGKALGTTYEHGIGYPRDVIVDSRNQPWWHLSWPRQTRMSAFLHETYHASGLTDFIHTAWEPMYYDEALGIFRKRMPGADSANLNTGIKISGTRREVDEANAFLLGRWAGQGKPVTKRFLRLISKYINREYPHAYRPGRASVRIEVPRRARILTQPSFHKFVEFMKKQGLIRT